jgi:putative ABC transport system permease protein
MMKALILAARNLRRDWRSAELRILLLALIVAVAAVTAVGFFTDRIQQVMVQAGAELLGADLRVSGTEALPTGFAEYARSRYLPVAYVLNFQSVVLHNDDTLLTEVKAVSEGYPLRGQLRVADTLFGAETVATGIPAPGKVWVEARLLIQLGLQVGESLKLGEMFFIIDKVLTFEPDRSGTFFQLAPRVLMNRADVEKTQLLGAGSRVKYGLLVAGALTEIANYRAWLEPQLQRGQKIEGVKDSNQEIRLALERAQQFLGLAALVAVILAGAAVAMAAQHFSQKQADASAIMRCLGATQSLIMQIYLLRLLGLGILASLLGCVLGWGAQWGLSMLVADYFSTLPLPAPSLQPVLVGLATGLITLLGFALVPVLRIRTVPPLRVLRHEMGATPAAVWQVLSVAGIAMASLMFWQAGDTQLALWMIGGTLVTLVVLMSAAYGLVHSLRLFRGRANVAWRFGLANLARRAQASSLQLTAIGLGIMALLLLAVVRIDLLTSWQARLPAGTHNHFMVNIQPDEVVAVQAKLTMNLPLPQNKIILYPIILSQLIAINNQPVSAKNYSGLRAKQLAERTFSMSYLRDLPADNKIVAGRFWNATDQGQLSVEEGLAKELGIKLADRLQFRVAGQEVQATVTSLRAVQWDSFHPNFFILATPDVLHGQPTTYITSFYLPDVTSRLIPDLVREFPSVTVINIEAIMAQVRQIMNRASLAIEYVFVFTLLAGLMVLYAAISASHEERLYESAILRTLGATRYQVLWGLITEFLTLGILAGLLAAVVATGLGYGLAVYVLDLPYHFNLWLGVIGVLGGALGVGLAGVLGTRRVLRCPPLEILRR